MSPDAIGVGLPDRRRRCLLGFGAAALTGLAGMQASRAQPEAGKQYDLVNLLSFQNHPSDWTEALNQASAVARRVYIPAGEYLIRSARWPSNTEIFGDGDASVLRMPADAGHLIYNDSGSPAVEHNIANLAMRDLQLRGTCDVDGFSEFRHLLSLNGVTGVHIQRVLFRGFRGDGLYLGSGSAERHNSNITVEACRFDGINRRNRNAISVIDCDGLLVENCRFDNVTSPKMPGAVDIEPNENPFHIVRNIRIRKNSFNNIGGNAGVVAVFVPAKVMRAPANISVEENISDNYAGTGAFFLFNDHRPPNGRSEESNIRLVGNRARRGASPFLLLTGRQGVVQDNDFSDFSRSGFIGYSAPVYAVSDFSFYRNTMTRCGLVAGSAVTIFNGDGLRFTGNRFIDSGNGNPITAAAIVFAHGRSANVDFDSNEFSARPGTSLAAIRNEVGHVFVPATNRFAGNRLHGLENHFRSTAQ
jgi:hypothetical protein